MMNQEELDPKEVQQETQEQAEAPQTEAQEEVQEVMAAEVSEGAEEATDDQVRTVEAEDDHEEPKEQKLQIPDFDALDLEQSLEAIKQHVGSYPPHRIKGIVESGRSRMLRELNAQQAEAKEKYLAEGGNIIDFRYDQPMRKQLARSDHRRALSSCTAAATADIAAQIHTGTIPVDRMSVHIKSLDVARGRAPCARLLVHVAV